MEGLDDDGRREKAVESMKLDMGAVESAERDLMEVSEMMHVDDDRFGENEICDVFQAGFMMGDRVLRFAVVRVAN